MWGALQPGLVCVGGERHLQAVGGALDLRGAGAEGGALPCSGDGCWSGLWSNPEWEKAVVGIAREAVAMCVRPRTEGSSAYPEQFSSIKTSCNSSLRSLWFICLTFVGLCSKMLWEGLGVSLFCCNSHLSCLFQQVC